VTDFYKKLSLDCSAQQIAVDMFMLNTQYADIATVGQCHIVTLSPSVSVTICHTVDVAVSQCDC